MFLLAPFVVFFKSKRLNKALLFIEHLTVVSVFVIGLLITIFIIFVPVIILYLVNKIVYFKATPYHHLKILDFFI